MAPATKKGSTTTANASSATHPPYLQMISEAITTLKDRTGSSQPAIAKFIEEQYRTGLPPNFKKILSVQLKKFVKSEKLIKVKNSYKVSATEKVKLLANSAKEIQMKKDAKKATGTEKSKGSEKVIAKKAVEKAAKTKRLSLVKTPEALKRKVKVPNMKSSVTGGKLKRLSQVKTPDALKKKVATAGNMKVTSKSLKSSNKKAKK